MEFGEESLSLCLFLSKQSKNFAKTPKFPDERHVPLPTGNYTARETQIPAALCTLCRHGQTITKLKLSLLRILVGSDFKLL